MATKAIGPTSAGGMQPIVKDGYELIYYPDVHNDALQREGKPPVFYWMPNYVHLARKDGNPDGDLLFSMIRFAGRQTSDTTIGLDEGEEREVAGGVVAFTATSAPPDHVLEQSQEKIMEMYRGSSDYFWGIRSSANPIFRPVPIVSNITAVSNLSPNADGSVSMPEEVPAAGGPPNAPRSTMPLKNFRSFRVPPMITQRGFSVKSFGRSRSRGDLEPWYWNLQGQGNGSIDPMGQNAYSALLGIYPTSILWGAFHGAYSPIFVQQALKIKFWAPLIEIKIRGDWQRIFSHFSANAKGRYLWFSGDISAEFNNLRISGGIEVEINVDPTIPGASDLTDYIEKKTEMVQKAFEEQAKGVIFQPAPEVEAAQASSGGGLFGIWGAGLALKYRRDETRLSLEYHERREMAYLQDHVISSSLEGLYEEIEANPEVERKYFTTVYMDDWPRKLGRIIKPVVRWPKPAQNWAGEPVAFVSAQVGYPNTRGEIMWVGEDFNKAQPEDYSWNVGITQKEMADVVNAPANWSSDKTFIKRRVHMMEPPDQAENPFVQVQIEDNVIELDPGEYGSLVNDITLEVRADSAGRIRVGPIDLGAYLEDRSQKVEVTLKAVDENGRDIDRFPPVKLSWNEDDQEEPRFWSVFTGDETIMPYFKYQVRCIVKGSFFSKGMEWTGPWNDHAGNGAITLSIPYPEDDGVSVRSTTSSDISTPPGSTTAPGNPSTEGSTPTPPPGGDTSTPPPNREQPRSGAEESGIEISSWKVEESAASRGTKGVPPAGPYRDAPTSESDEDGISVLGWKTQ